jgi:hypothetical protein
MYSIISEPGEYQFYYRICADILAVMLHSVVLGLEYPNLLSFSVCKPFARRLKSSTFPLHLPTFHPQTMPSDFFNVLKDLGIQLD